VWSSYSPRHAASLLGMPESTVRGLARAGLLTSGELPLKLTFRDLAALRTIKSLLSGGVPLARVRRELGSLRARLGHAASLAELPLEARDGHVAIRGEAAPVVGQLSLPFAPMVMIAPDGALHALPQRPIEAPEPTAALTGDDWFDRAIALEDSDAAAAIDAYRRALRLRPDHVEAWINLGRLHAEAGAGAAAADCFRRALELDPTDPTALSPSSLSSPPPAPAAPPRSAISPRPASARAGPPPVATPRRSRCVAISPRATRRARAARPSAPRPRAARWSRWCWAPRGIRPPPPPRRRPVILVEAGIHAGEIEGKDAGFWLARELVRRRGAARACSTR
jgi:tetratricopeptide (TPR) repeat protein